MKVYTKRGGSSAGRYVKDLSLENVDLILFKLESLYQKGC